MAGTLKVDSITNRAGDSAPAYPYGTGSANNSTSSATVTNGQTMMHPYLNIQSGHTYTVNSGGQLVSVGAITVNGTLVVNGVLRVL